MYSQHHQRKFKTLVESFLICFFVCFGHHIIAQEIPVDHLRGRPIISIPLASLNFSDISVPVSIVNNGDALRVRESEGSCGMGWNLIAGGQVSREVRGLPDDVSFSTSDPSDLRVGWLIDGNALAIQSFIPSGDDNLVVCTDEIPDWNFFESRGVIRDTEPDIFRFSAPGISGQFVFDANGMPRLLDDSDLNIVVLGTPINGTGIAGFEITTNRGVKYNFSVVESHYKKSELAPSMTESFVTNEEYFRYRKGLAYVSAWHLSAMTSANTGVAASFTYGAGNETPGVAFTTSISALTVDSLLYQVTTYAKLNLTKITLNSYTVDIERFDRLINKVTVTDNSTNSQQEFEFNYQIMKSASDTYPSDFMAFLKEVKQLKNCVPSPSYTFTYQDVNFAGNTLSISRDKGWGQDWFGYYNGDVGNQNRAAMYLYGGESWPRRFRLTPLPGVTAGLVMNGNRTVNTSTNGFGALTSINYPTGGTVTFTYESHKYFDSSTNEELFGGGLRIKSITASGGDAAINRSTNQSNAYRTIRKEFEYILPSGATSGKIVNAPLLHIWQAPTQEDYAEETTVMYSRVREKIIGQGSKLFEFSLPGMYPLIVDGDWQATKTRIARNGTGCGAPDPSFIGYGTYPYPYSTNYDFARGLPIRQSEFWESGTLLRERSISYIKLQRNASTLKGLKVIKHGSGSMYLYGVYNIMVGTGYAISQEVIKEASEENPASLLQKTIDYTYNSYGLTSEVRETQTDNSITKKIIRYAKDFSFTAPIGTPAQAIKKLIDANRFAEVIETEERYQPAGGIESTVNATLTLFRDAGNNRVYPQQIFDFPSGAAYSPPFVAADQSFSFDTDYRPIKTLEAFDAKGRLRDEIDYKRNRMAYHWLDYAPNPTATFYNGKAAQCVFEGFEGSTGNGLLSVGSDPATSIAGWTGDKAKQLTTSFTLQSAVLVDKGENRYRFSCWAKAAQVATLTIRARNGASVHNFTTLSYGAANINQWTYLETTLDVTAAPSTFTFELATSATVTIDDVLFLPGNARASLQTYRPLEGITSSTDDRGNSTTINYDAQGRRSNTFDRRRNLVNRMDYGDQKPATSVPSALFKSSLASIEAGQAVVFTPTANNCFAISYEWKVNGTVVTTGGALTRTFIQPGAYTVELKVTDPTFGSSVYAKTYCVEVPFVFNLYVVGGGDGISGSTSANCPVESKSLTVNPIPQGCGMSYKWYYSLVEGPTLTWILLPSYTGPTINYTAAFIDSRLLPNTSYYMKVVATANCVGLRPSPCSGASIISREAILLMQIGPCN